MATIELDDTLYEQVTAVAQSTGQSPREFVQQVLHERTDSVATQHSATFQRNHAAFQAKLPELLENHADQYVAILNGEIVGLGLDRMILLRDMRAIYGYVSMLVTKVTATPRRIHIPYRRIVR